MSRLLFGAMAVLGLALYLWPALAAPVVQWSDSAVDLAWAREGAGIVSPASDPRHSAKPLYLLFLRAADALGGARGVVVLQSLLVWIAIALTAILVARRLGALVGVTLYLILLFFLRLRDAGSAVMTEALAAALLLPIAAVSLDPPRRPRSLFGLGLATAALFLVRPNAGGIALVLAVAALPLAAPRPDRPWLLLAGFAALSVPFLLVSQPPRDPAAGLSDPLRVGGAAYTWVSSAGPPADALAAWKDALRGDPHDVRRHLWWKALHGILGLEYYDARWSPLYRRLDGLARTASPFLVLASISVLIAAPFGGAAIPKTLGLLLVALAVVQGLLIGGLPRYGLCLLPALFVFAAAAAPAWLGGSPGRRLVGLAVFVLVLLIAAGEPQVCDADGGLLERAGVAIEQTIPRGALPSRGPATLHVRIAPPVLPTHAGLAVVGPDGRTLYDSRQDADRDRPFLTVPLPDAILEASRRGPVRLSLQSFGDYDSFHYLAFPVVPAPWCRGMSRRAGGEELSPVSGIPAGSLDWWAHPGAP